MLDLLKQMKKMITLSIYILFLLTNILHYE